MSRRLWPLILLTAVLAVTALVRTFQAEAARARAVAGSAAADELASAQR